MGLSRHYLSLTVILFLGALLRFLQLEVKPLWLDEIMTAIFSLGKSYQKIPLDIVFSPEVLSNIFSDRPPATCSQIAATVATESTHPPLFFCLMHDWLNRVDGSFVWQLRSLPALFGVGAIAASYYLNRVAFSKEAGVMAAGVMAVSPFAVYLSQEARHYTLPMLLISLSLTALISTICRLIQGKKFPIRLGLLWAICNSIALYIHYFSLLAIAAQILTTIIILIWHYRTTIERISSKAIALTGFCFTLPFLAFLPWLPTLYGHFNRSETDWFQPFQPSWVDSINPIFQTLAGWTVMVVAFPVENQPLPLAIPAAILMLLFVGALLWFLSGTIRQLIAQKSTQLSTLILLLFTAIVLLEYLTIVYGLGKDITSAVRYHFIYYPSICALIGAGLWYGSPRALLPLHKRVYALFVFTVGTLSSVFVLSNLAFQKPYDPQGVAKIMNLEPSRSLVMVVGYENYQEVALGLSFALELSRQRAEGGVGNDRTQFAFLSRSPHYQNGWQSLAELENLGELPLNLWVVAPGLRQREYPPELAIASGKSCALDPVQYYRLGIPYQLYRCRE
jgi:uncharacterized membrane protein